MVLELMWIIFGGIYVICRVVREKRNSPEKTEKRLEEYCKSRNINISLQRSMEMSLNAGMGTFCDKSYKFNVGKDFFPRYGLKCWQDVYLLCGGISANILEFYLQEFMKEMYSMGYNYSFDFITHNFKSFLLMNNVCKEENNKLVQVKYMQRIEKDADFSEFIRIQREKKNKGEEIRPHKIFLT